ncbi:MAG: DUF2877 domain-containing protein [Negativicutes bacterium]|nr:DUF2877 domain-containing protein [Negativicutes bacterium]
MSGDEIFLAKLDSGCFSGTVHSVFRQTVNIYGMDGNLYSLVAEKLDNAPNTLRIAGFFGDFTCLDIAPGTVVLLESGALIAGTIAVYIHAAKRWRENLPAFPTAAGLARLEQNLHVLRQTVRTEGKPGGLRGLIDAEHCSANDVFSRVLSERSRNLLGALAQRDFSRAEAAGRSLLGLGGGQTPSGDDFCTGLIAVMHLPGGPFDDNFRRFGSYLAAEARQLTTAISQAMLARAAEGRVREKLVNLLRSAVQGDTAGTAHAARQVLAIGSLSGADLATGIMSGLELGISLRRVEREENNGNTNHH